MGLYEFGIGGPEVDFRTSHFVPLLHPSLPFRVDGYCGCGNATISSVGYGAIHSHQMSAVTAIAEPGIWALMTTGFGLVGSALRRRISLA